MKAAAVPFNFLIARNECFHSLIAPAIRTSRFPSTQAAKIRKVPTTKRRVDQLQGCPATPNATAAAAASEHYTTILASHVVAIATRIVVATTTFFQVCATALDAVVDVQAGATFPFGKATGKCCCQATERIALRSDALVRCIGS